MAKTLLAVDDSVTMRKVLEITFSGEDFRVITAEGAQSALGRLGENPSVFVVDTVLGTDDGYALAKELRRRSPDAAIVMLASRYAPYDQARGRDAGVDDWADKPFDTQQLIDKVRKAMLSKGGGTYRSPSAAPGMVGGTPQGMPYRAPAPPQPAMAGAGGMGVGQGMAPGAPGTGPAAPGGRTGTLMFGENTPHAAPPIPPRGGSAPQSGAQAASASSSASSAGAHAIGSAVNGHLAGKLGELGLTPEQMDAVIALSRDVVERVVWEVVPQLAETMIREEIDRLTRA